MWHGYYKNISISWPYNRKIKQKKEKVANEKKRKNYEQKYPEAVIRPILNNSLARHISINMCIQIVVNNLDTKVLEKLQI